MLSCVGVIQNGRDYWGGGGGCRQLVDLSLTLFYWRPFKPRPFPAGHCGSVVLQGQISRKLIGATGGASRSSDTCDFVVERCQHRGASPVCKYEVSDVIEVTVKSNSVVLVSLTTHAHG